MRAKMILVPLMLCASPVLAQTAAVPSADPAQIQRALNDPAMADRLARAMQALSKSFMNLPAGEVQAAIEGRAPTEAERKMTVRDVGRRDDPNFERDLQQQMANARPMIEQSMKALSAALPALMQSMQSVGQSLDRAISNMPDPTYPKR